MIVNGAFIEDVVNSFHKQITARKNLCATCRTEHNLEFYRQHAYQELYALRYLPAYYFEYCVLANLLYRRVQGDYDSLNIASLGCGLSPDYYAFKDNLKTIDFSYLGYDATQWSTQKHMPEAGKNLNFIFKSVQAITPEELKGIDVYVFPKSIGDIRSSGKNVLEDFAGKVVSTTKSRLFFLISYVSAGFDSPVDTSDFQVIHKKLVESGFQTEDDPKSSFISHDNITKTRPLGLRKINKGFLYPNDKFISCNEHKKEDAICKSCMVPRKPILYNSYMSFQLLEYIKQ